MEPERCTHSVTITNSNEMFAEFKDRMETQAKLITTLERDNTKLRRQKETADGKLGRFEKEQKRVEAELLKSQVTLCAGSHAASASGSAPLPS